VCIVTLALSPLRAIELAISSHCKLQEINSSVTDVIQFTCHTISPLLPGNACQPSSAFQHKTRTSQKRFLAEIASQQKSCSTISGTISCQRPSLGSRSALIVTTTYLHQYSRSVTFDCRLLKSLLGHIRWYQNQVCTSTGRACD
jgi:hypothetical protein